MTLNGDFVSRTFVFLTAPKPSDVDYQTYREMRSAALFAYCHAIKTRFPTVMEAIGTASEPFSEEVTSQDFLYVNFNEARVFGRSVRSCGFCTTLTSSPSMATVADSKIKERQGCESRKAQGLTG